MSSISTEDILANIQTPTPQTVRQSKAQETIHLRAKQIAHVLYEIAKPGDCALMAYPANCEYDAALLGCIYAGVIAVPACPVIEIRNAGELMRIAGTCLPRLLLCATATRDYFDSKFMAAVSDATLVVTDEVALTLPEDLPEPSHSATALIACELNGLAEPTTTAYSLADLLGDKELARKYFGPWDLVGTH